MADEDFLAKYRIDPEDRLDGQIPSLEELFRAMDAPHDTDVHVLKYLDRHPDLINNIQSIRETCQEDDYRLHFDSQSPLERIKAELAKRQAKGEKGGELSL